MTFYEAVFTEGAGTANLVPNPRFGDGATGWGHWGEAGFTVASSDRGSGSMVRVTATPSQTLVANSGSFPVTPGATYHFRVAVRVPEASPGAAYVAPIFLGGTEARRDKYALVPTPIPLGSATTDAAGAFSLTTSALEAGRYHLQAGFAGDAIHWPARAHVYVVVP